MVTQPDQNFDELRNAISSTCGIFSGLSVSFRCCCISSPKYISSLFSKSSAESPNSCLFACMRYSNSLSTHEHYCSSNILSVEESCRKTHICQFMGDLYSKTSGLLIKWQGVQARYRGQTKTAHIFQDIYLFRLYGYKYSLHYIQLMNRNPQVQFMFSVPLQLYLKQTVVFKLPKLYFSNISSPYDVPYFK